MGTKSSKEPSEAVVLKALKLKPLRSIPEALIVVGCAVGVPLDRFRILPEMMLTGGKAGVRTTS